MSDRFDLEQGILKCWNVTEDIDSLYTRVLESEEMSVDEISNYLLGLKSIYDVKFDQLFKTFETLVHEGKIK